MLTKEGLRQEFSKDWKKHYEVAIFKERGFQRKQCATCGKFFWTLDVERKKCADSSCEPYSFIGKPITIDRWDYNEMWKRFEKFFVSNGHKSIKRYPVIDRVRPDLYFTIASIQNFQRIDNGNLNFVYPKNPLVIILLGKSGSGKGTQASLLRKKLKLDFNVDFSKGSIDFVLKNPFYCGIMRYNGEEYPHNYEVRNELDLRKIVLCANDSLVRYISFNVETLSWFWYFPGYLAHQQLMEYHYCNFHQ